MLRKSFSRRSRYRIGGAFTKTQALCFVNERPISTIRKAAELLPESLSCNEDLHSRAIISGHGWTKSRRSTPMGVTRSQVKGAWYLLAVSLSSSVDLFVPLASLGVNYPMEFFLRSLLDIRSNLPRPLTFTYERTSSVTIIRQAPVWNSRARPSWPRFPFWPHRTMIDVDLDECRSL